MAAIGLLLLCGGVSAAAPPRRAPNLAFTSLSGDQVRLADLRGAITVVNFWATWCGPCREEFPMLSRLAQKYAKENVRFISISADEDPASRRQRSRIDLFLKEQQPAMKIWLGATLDDLDRCSLGNVLPATMILDADGQVLFRIEGQAREEDITTPLEWLLHSQSSPSPKGVVKRY